MEKLMNQLMIQNVKLMVEIVNQPLGGRDVGDGLGRGDEGRISKVPPQRKQKAGNKHPYNEKKYKNASTARKLTATKMTSILTYKETHNTDRRIGKQESANDMRWGGNKYSGGGKPTR